MVKRNNSAEQVLPVNIAGEPSALQRELERKRVSEAEMVSQMIALYCRGNHSNALRAADACIVRVGFRKISLCTECSLLNEYSAQRIERCQHMLTKTFCSVCPTPCYKPDMQERIRQVMRWSGPRMIRYKPVAAMRHAWATMKAKRTKKG